jgi:LCP family protein required for cell wall assembly
MKINFKPSIAQIIIGAVALVLFVGVFIGVNYLVSTWCITSLPGNAVNGCGNAPVAGPTVSPGQTPGTAIAPPPTAEPGIPEAPLPAAWDGASRVNILVMGLDSEVVTDANGNVLPVSPDRVGPARSDTMIVLTVDPQTMTAGMISVPRDLLVNIPGFGYSRINTAYGDGEGAKLPGGGPGLAMKTVEQVLGVPIQYYGQIEFWAFSKFIDDIGKINVKVRKKIIIDPVGPGEDKVMLSADWHLLNGPRALAYVRNRHTENGDVDRSQRQQDVILAIRDKVLSPANLPLLVLGAPQVYKDLSAGIHTNLTFEQMMALGMLAKDIPADKIKRGLIDNTMVTFGNITLGGQPAAVLKPIPDKIRELRDVIFATGGAVSPLAKGADAIDLAKQEGASVIVLNGSGTQGLALQTGDYLKSLGINVINNGNANQNSVTKVIDHTGRPYMLKYLKGLFGLNSSSQITSTYDPNASVDIEIIIGNDWALKNPMSK